MDEAKSLWAESLLDRTYLRFSGLLSPFDMNAFALSETAGGWKTPAISDNWSSKAPANDLGNWSTPAFSKDATGAAGVFQIDHMRRAKQLLSELVRFSARKDDWDGDDGIAPTAETLAEARAFLNFLALAGGVPQSTYSPGDGEINFEWRAAKRFTEVGFNGDGTVSWFHRDASGEIFRDEPFDRQDVRKNTELLKILGVEDAGD
ncbi:hypothetical protein [Ensifer adhaerens]|uniref:hypothetical protein n=1 Tax=Ensifer adhaerens TaxID=106592 RepID=UPI00202F4D51|nr:hypothetical protein [Ensifer adhaerens]